MTVTASDAARNAAVNAIVDLVDAGTTDAAGELRLYDDAALTTELVAIDLNNPAYNTAVSGTAAMDVTGPLSGTASATGVAAVGVVYDRDNIIVFRGTVSESGGGGDFIISDTSIATSDLVQINDSSLTLPAS